MIGVAMKRKNKTNAECITFLREKWRATLLRRFDFFIKFSPEAAKRMNLIIDAMIKTLENIFLAFSDLKDTQFNLQIMSADDGVYDQRMAEMLFFARLRDMGFSDFESGDAGPDFFAKKGGESFCFEVVTPTPKKAIRELINKPIWSAEERDLVFKERLLSVTSAIDGKLKNLIRHKRKFEIDNTRYVIVVNDSLLLPYDKPWYGAMESLCFGDSSLPIVVDATVGSGDVDLENSLSPDALDGNAGDVRKMVVKNNISISVNGGKAQMGGDSVLLVKMRQQIPTRDETNTINVDLIESTSADGFYQITLREDLFFFHVFSFSRSVAPHSALITSSGNSEALKRAIGHLSFYSSDNDLIQPITSPARLLGRMPDEFNNQAIYDKYFKPVLSERLDKDEPN
jgi:hypothetical protein